MSSNSDDIQAVGSDTRPLMLDRTDYESWSQRIRLYCRGKENCLQIISSIDQGPFELGTTRDTLGTTSEGGVLLGPERPRTYDSLNDPVCVEKRIKCIPPNNSKENFLATFTPQTQLTPEQVFWSINLAKRKAEELKANALPLLVLPPATVDVKTPKVSAFEKHAIDVEPIPPRLNKNQEVHLHYIKCLKENVETLREIVEDVKVERPLDTSLASVCRYTKHSHELLEYVIGTCPKDFGLSDKQNASTNSLRKK
ncbi:hypothetical protein Tco_0935664 [Tanacetum coccineum]